MGSVNQYDSPSEVLIKGALAAINDAGILVPQALATGTAGILVPPGSSHVKLTAAAAVIGATLPVGSFDGQLLFLTINTAAANTVTFAAKATSYVAGGAATSLAGLATHLFRWDATDALWYQVGPLTN